MAEIKSFKDLVRMAPKELQDVLWQQWKAPQNPKHHPEGNTLKHITVVVTRAINQHPDDIDMILSAFFHDLGKYYTLGYKNGNPTAHGHENKSVEFVDQFSDWITSMGGDVERVKFIVTHHMRIKPDVWNVMKQSKKDKLTQHPDYEKLANFGKIDKGGLSELVSETFNETMGDRSEYLKWKKNNVTIRGVSNGAGGENNGMAMLGRGLYTAYLGNKELAKKYGQVYFVVGAIPKHPKIFNSINEWEIWYYNTLVYQYSKSVGKNFPDKRDFNANTTIEGEMQKLGFDGILIKGREMVNFTPPENVKYFRTEDELYRYYQIVVKNNS